MGPEERGKDYCQMLLLDVLRVPPSEFGEERVSVTGPRGMLATDKAWAKHLESERPGPGSICRANSS